MSGGLNCGRLVRVLRFVAAAAVLAFAATYLWPADQSYVVDAQTRGISLTFDGGAISAWRLGSATICMRARSASSVSSTQPTETVPACPLTHYRPLVQPASEIVWLKGSRIDLQATADGGIAIDLVRTAPGQSVLIEGSAVPIPANSRILISQHSWAAHPVLPFSSADIDIGNVPASGEQGIVMSGRYELHQTLPFRSVPITVDDGLFHTGDSLGFVPGRALALPPRGAESGYQVYGFIAPVGGSTGTVSVVAYSALSRATLRIDRLGVETRYVEADWTHRAIRDPVLLAIAALLSILVVLSPLGFAWKSSRRGRFRR